MDPLATLVHWPVRRLAAAAVAHGDVIATRGDVDEVFGLASVSKPISAMAVLVAHEEGTADLDGHLTTLEGQNASADGTPHVTPQPPDPDDRATIADLLAHAGGFSPDLPIRLTAPRTRRIYSTATYDLLADEIAATASMPFEEYLTAAVTAPLGMGSTVLDGSPGSDIRSTVADLVRFMRAWREPVLIHSSTIERATSPHLPHLVGVLPGFGRQDPNPWGLGPEIRGHKQPHWSSYANDPSTFGHFGRSGTLWWMDPAADRGFVDLTDEGFGPWAAASWPIVATDVLAA